jgi:transcriptional regulator GlxA family with amidase domain
LFDILSTFEKYDAKSPQKIERREMNFGFLLFDDLEELDLVGPWEVISIWRNHFGGPADCLMIAEKKDPVKCFNGMIITPHKSFEESPALDYLLVPGGRGTRKEVENKSLIEFVARQAEGCRFVLSVCTGSLILHSAGLLKGKKATTHFSMLDNLRNLAEVEVIEKRFVKDGKIWTSAGVSAGIDMALELVAQEAGEETAGKVQLYAEYYPAGTRFGNAHSEPQAPAYLKT